MSTHNRNKLSLIYDKRYKDFVVKYPRSADGNFVMYKLVNDNLEYKLPTDKSYPFNFDKTNFIEELERRGYDPTTIKFSIELKKDET